jgi:hypothetical protein
MALNVTAQSPSGSRKGGKNCFPLGFVAKLGKTGRGRTTTTAAMIMMMISSDHGHDQQDQHQRHDHDDSAAALPGLG